MLINFIKNKYSFNSVEIHNKVKMVLDWKVISSDNILIALLSHHLDGLAVEYMGYYSHLLNTDLLIYCIEYGNIDFLK
jgi:hypothetical protein